MHIADILKSKGAKKIEERERIAESIADGTFSADGLKEVADELNDKQIAVLLEAIELVTGQRKQRLSVEYLHFAEGYLLSDNNSCKREASRIIGNMASDYPAQLTEAIPRLLVNTKNSGTVVRWASAYALAKIVILDAFAKSDLAASIKEVYEAETESGVKNQYAKALKKLKAI